MSKLNRILKHPKVIILIIFLILALAAIRPAPWTEGAAIRSVDKDSPAMLAGITNPKPGSPMGKEIIVAINNKPITNDLDYHEYTSTLSPNVTIQIKTNKAIYKVRTTETIEVKNGTEIPTGQAYIGLKVFDAPKTNIRKGLDLQGGTRVLLAPEEKVSPETLETIIDILRQRLNVYGLSDIVVRQAADLSDNQYIKVEIAGATEEEVAVLLGQQGKFEAKIGNETAFVGGTDITVVGAGGLDPRSPCGQTQSGQICTFQFPITLTPEAAKRHARLTDELEIIRDEAGSYLNESLYLYLDNELVDELKIGSDLKGKVTTDIAISGPGFGSNQQEAALDAMKNMKRLQTILKTGSLPVKINIVQTDQISAQLGKDFLKNAILLGIVVITVVIIVVFIRYRAWQVAMPMAVTLVSEIVLLLGLASSIGWNIDLAAIAGIIIAVGTGVDHQIIIADEILRGEREKIFTWKEMIKKAFFIIMVAYFTTVVAMVPLFFAGAGLLKGFAITTIAGVTFGVFITRPAYAAVVEILIKK